jgi:hypothetical protein
MRALSVHLCYDVGVKNVIVQCDLRGAPGARRAIHIELLTRSRRARLRRSKRQERRREPSRPALIRALGEAVSNAVSKAVALSAPYRAGLGRACGFAAALALGRTFEALA